MKKQLLFLSLLLSFGSAVLSAATPPEKILVDESIPQGRGNRSLGLSPQVTFSADQSMLEIRFYSEQYFVVKVVDATGSTVFVSQLTTDGGIYNYMLPALQTGTYTLMLESVSKNYTGQFSYSK